MLISEQVAYLNKSIREGTITASGKPMRVQVHEGQPERQIQKVVYVLGSKSHEIPLRAYDNPDIEDTEARLDALAEALNNLADVWDDD